jgi:peroxiredoxin Q/BCP
MSATLTVGTEAPDFSLPANTGRNITLSSFRGKKHVVLFFYPKDMTPICTKEACLFRDNYEAFTQAGAEVIGISSDSESSHQNFARNHNLQFHLVSDLGGKVRKLYGVKNTLGFMPGRETFVIDKQGVIRHVSRSQFNALKHVDETLNFLQQLG